MTDVDDSVPCIDGCGRPATLTSVSGRCSPCLATEVGEPSREELAEWAEMRREEQEEQDQRLHRRLHATLERHDAGQALSAEELTELRAYGYLPQPGAQVVEVRPVAEDAGEGIEVRERRGHLDLTPEYCQQARQDAMRADVGTVD